MATLKTNIKGVFIMLFKSNTLVLCMAASILLALVANPISAEENRLKRNKEYSRSIYPELVEIRRDLFAHPEASGAEKRTSSIVANYLNALGLEVKTNIGGYGVVGILKGKKKGKRIIWRADMDAATFEFGKHDNHELAHVCGHDVNTTIGLGIAKTLSRDVDTLAGTVYFLFQPAEESQKGARAMIEDGLFDMVQADEIYASHLAPLPTGAITSLAGNLFSHSRYIQLEFAGTNDAQPLAEQINTMMSSLTRVTSPEKFVNLLNTSDADIGLGSPKTIYQDYVLFGGRPNVRSSDNKLILSAELFTDKHADIDAVVAKLENQIRASKFNHRFDSITVLHEREGVSNDAQLLEYATQMLKTDFGDDAFIETYGRIPFASEDFGHFQKTVPGVYFFIGTANAETGNVAFPHMPNFEVDEMVIHYGVSRFSSFIEQRLLQ